MLHRRHWLLRLATLGLPLLLLGGCGSRDGAEDGTTATTEEERCWRFTPAKAWIGGEHRVLVEAVLEDLAGNSLARPFEVDLRAEPPRNVPPVITLTFHPRL